MNEIQYYRILNDEKNSIFKNIRRRLEVDKDILFAYLHGSFLRRKYFRDIDIAIWIEESDKAFYYTVKFSVKLTSILKFPVDIQVLNNAPLSFKYYVFMNGRLIFSRDEDLRTRIIDKVVREYIDFKYFLKLHSPIH